ncbi:hypothetical protein F5141DRAFT_407184 [Pisolithus sp. B1]|nr:hypothetical protein F5141DRAFT_407184 [Pisolithus sp. B1]
MAIAVILVTPLRSQRYFCLFISRSDTRLPGSSAVEASWALAVSAAAALLASLLAFFFYRKIRSAEATYNHLHNIHTSQRQPEAPIDFSTSMVARGPPGLVRQSTPSSCSLNVYRRPSNEVSTGPGYPAVLGPSQLGDESRTQSLVGTTLCCRSARELTPAQGRSFPETPGEGERQSRQLFQDGRSLTQNAGIQAMTPLPATKLPPAYAHAVEAGSA